MRCITYAGETVTTSNAVGKALVDLTAELAKRGLAEAVTIPIVLDDETRTIATADLVIGLGNDVLSVPTPWDGEDLDFAEGVSDLEVHLERMRPQSAAYLVSEPDTASESLLSDLDLNTSDFRTTS